MLDSWFALLLYFTCLNELVLLFADNKCCFNLFALGDTLLLYVFNDLRRMEKYS